MRTTTMMAGAWLLAAPLLLAAPAGAWTVDTGAPAGSGLALALDVSNFVAGEVGFGSNNRLDAVQAFVTGGNAGETFTIALYDASGAAGLPGAGALDSATVQFTADGWNGASGLGWTLNPGASYWLAVEMRSADALGNGGDTLGNGSGALLPTGVPQALARTAFNDGSYRGYQLADPSLGFGLRAAAVPEPASLLMWLAGLGLFALSGARRHRQG